ncbi:MAG: hypothetical protein WBN83_15155 [Desulfoprunum sp.]|uniref:hypothetical protein n=1 Tax=Desulfoprunum sp. TaxID=2020866 RepID=UPI003C749F2C
MAFMVNRMLSSRIATGHSPHSSFSGEAAFAGESSIDSSCIRTVKAAGNLEPVKVKSDQETLLAAMAVPGGPSSAEPDCGRTTSTVNSKNIPPEPRTDHPAFTPSGISDNNALKKFRKIGINGFSSQKNLPMRGIFSEIQAPSPRSHCGEYSAYSKEFFPARQRFLYSSAKLIYKCACRLLFIPLSGLNRQPPAAVQPTGRTRLQGRIHLA